MKSINQADITFYLKKTGLLSFDCPHYHTFDKISLKKKKIRIVGKLATKERAPWTPQATVYCPRKLTIPIIIVLFSSDWVKMRGQRKSFQIQVNCSVAKTANADKLNGTAILVRICHSFAPSSMAASRTSAGIVEKKLRINKLHIGIPNAV